MVITAYVRFANALAWHAHEVACGLARAGHEVLLYCRRGSPLATATANAPFAVNRDFNLSSSDPRDLARALRTLSGELRRFQPQVLNPHCPPGHSFLAMARRASRLAAPLIRTVADPRPPNRNLVNRWLHRRHTDGFIFTTESSRQRYADMVPLLDQCSRTILPGFRANDYHEKVTTAGFRSALGVGAQQLLVGIIARMSPEKGQETLFEALSLLPPKTRERFVCVVAGEDSRERGQADLRRIANQFGVSAQVKFRERLNDVRPLMKDLDIGLITSKRSEAICRVALEYMSLGIPIIATDVNILPEVVQHGRNGWIFAAGDPRELARLLQLALNEIDTFRSLGQEGFRMVREELSLEREIEHILRFFEMTTRNPRARFS